jgi:uncharacterized membrane-anchored protein YhcB (DUF1043 family)
MSSKRKANDSFTPSKRLKLSHDSFKSVASVSRIPANPEQAPSSLIEIAIGQVMKIEAHHTSTEELRCDSDDSERLGGERLRELIDKAKKDTRSEMWEECAAMVERSLKFSSETRDTLIRDYSDILKGSSDLCQSKLLRASQQPAKHDKATTTTANCAVEVSAEVEIRGKDKAEKASGTEEEWTPYCELVEENKQLKTQLTQRLPVVEAENEELVEDDPKPKARRPRKRPKTVVVLDCSPIASRTRSALRKRTAPSKGRRRDN